MYVHDFVEMKSHKFNTVFQIETSLCAMSFIGGHKFITSIDVSKLICDLSHVSTNLCFMVSGL